MVSEYLRILGDDKRGKIIMLLSHSPLSAIELQSIIGVSQTNLSKHIKKLIEYKIIKYVKFNKYNYYYVNKDFINSYSFISEILAEYHKECIENRGLEIISKYVNQDNIEFRTKLINDEKNELPK